MAVAFDLAFALLALVALAYAFFFPLLPADPTAEPAAPTPFLERFVPILASLLGLAALFLATSDFLTGKPVFALPILVLLALVIILLGAEAFRLHFSDGGSGRPPKEPE